MDENQNVGAEGVGMNGEGEYKDAGEKQPHPDDEKVELTGAAAAEVAKKAEETTEFESPGMETKGGEAVEYSAGNDKKTEDPMEDIAKEEDQGTAVPEDVPVADEPVTEEKKEEPKPLDEQLEETEKFTSNPKLTESDKPGFNPNEEQDARYDNKVEGGIARPQTTGPQKTDGDAAKEGMQVKPRKPPEDKSNKYEVSGFTVNYEPKPGDGLIGVEICDYFDDIESAQASINGDKYLMPLAEGGFKVVTISSGAPKISHQERELYEYMNDERSWRRV